MSALLHRGIKDVALNNVNVPDGVETRETIENLCMRTRMTAPYGTYLEAFTTFAKMERCELWADG